MKRARHQNGSVVFDKRRKTWNFLWRENGQRRSKLIGTKQEYATKASAWKAAELLRPALALNQMNAAGVRTVSTLITEYRAERMSERFSTPRSNEAWIRNYILPTWGESPVTELQPREAELWLKSLALSPKSRVHIRGVLHQLWEFAMWRGDVPMQRNPMELVTIKGATKWSDVDWLKAELSITKGIVMQHLGEVKTEESHRSLSIDSELLAILKNWKQITQFPADEDWLFASPVQPGRLPLSYPHVWATFQKAAANTGIPQFGTHTLRHTYRSWLDAVGTPIAVQQKLMRHADIRTTLNIYGDVVTDEMRQAHSKVVRMALPRA